MRRRTGRRAGEIFWVWGIDRKNYAISTGRFQQGKMQGQWVLRLADGGVQQGPFVDGKRHGRWIYCKEDGTVYREERYLDGEEL